MSDVRLTWVQTRDTSIRMHSKISFCKPGWSTMWPIDHSSTRVAYPRSPEGQLEWKRGTKAISRAFSEDAGAGMEDPTAVPFVGSCWPLSRHDNKPCLSRSRLRASNDYGMGHTGVRSWASKPGGALFPSTTRTSCWYHTIWWQSGAPSLHLDSKVLLLDLIDSEIKPTIFIWK